jgi:hypothetical protein
MIYDKAEGFTDTRGDGTESGSRHTKRRSCDETPEPEELGSGNLNCRYYDFEYPHGCGLVGYSALQASGKWPDIPSLGG